MLAWRTCLRLPAHARSLPAHQTHLVRTLPFLTCDALGSRQTRPPAITNPSHSAWRDSQLDVAMRSCEAARASRTTANQTQHRQRADSVHHTCAASQPRIPRNHAYRIPPRKRNREGSDPPTRARPGGPAPAVDAIKQRQKQSHPPRPSPHLSSGSFDRPDSQDSCSSSSDLSAPAPAPALPSAPVPAMSQGPPPPPGNMFPYSQMAVHDMNGVGVCSCISFFFLRSVDG